MKSPEFESFFEQGETAQGRWQARGCRQQTRQGLRSAHAYAQSSGKTKECEVTTEANVRDQIVFQVSPDGTVTVLQASVSYSHASSRSGC